MKKEPKIIKFTPYTGVESEDVSGKKTKIILMENHLYFEVNYTKKVQVSKVDELGGEEIKDSIKFVEETGVKDKESIKDITKFTRTEYENDATPFKVYTVEVANAGIVLSFEIEKESERDLLYNELVNWKFGSNEQ